MFEIIKGLDGSYVIDEGKLKKIISVLYSENYFIYTGGWVEYKLDDGKILKIS